MIFDMLDFFLFSPPGFCAEFDMSAAVVQENYDADCKIYNPPCPEFYDSAEAYICKPTSYVVFSWLHSIVINSSNIAYVIYRITNFCFSISIRIMQTIISLKIYYSFKKIYY